MSTAAKIISIIVPQTFLSLMQSLESATSRAAPNTAASRKIIPKPILFLPERETGAADYEVGFNTNIVIHNSVLVLIVVLICQKTALELFLEA